MKCWAKGHVCGLDSYLTYVTLKNSKAFMLGTNETESGLD